MTPATVAVRSANAWALDFGGNRERIRAGVLRAKAAGARYVLGPELDLTGYGCEDHFLEPETERRAWEALADLVTDVRLHGILWDAGLPATHRGVRYDARVAVLNGVVLLVRPKRILADDGQHRESRWFAAWRAARTVEPFALPEPLRRATGRSSSTIGDAVMRLRDARIAFETCEELFAPDPPHVAYGLAGVDLIANGSASHHELRKMEDRTDRIAAATTASGGAYLYANLHGADGDAVVYDGGSLIAADGRILARGPRFPFADVTVASATIDLDAIRTGRAARPSRMRQAAAREPYPEIEVDFALADGAEPHGERPDTTAAGRAARSYRPAPTRPIAPEPLAPTEEIAGATSVWLWDRLRRAEAGGFFLALSGGSDSAAVATTVAGLCHRLADAVRSDGAPGDADGDVREALRTVLGEAPNAPLPTEPKVLASRLLTTAYLATRVSGDASRSRAREVAEQVGADHLEVELQDAVDAFAVATGATAHDATGAPLRFAAEGGEPDEQRTLENLQARARMVASYLLAQRTPRLRGVRGPRLVLGTANADESLVGYVTKYDAGAADLNPIGGLSKVDLRTYLAWARDAYRLPALDTVLDATPSAELAPAGPHGAQSDELEIGLTYEELSELGRWRANDRCGPEDAFERARTAWPHRSATEVAERVKRFYRSYARHRHKATVATPALHLERYAPNDRRYDLRPIQVPTDWPEAFRAIDRRVAELEGDGPA